jgi:hypothetical protein
MESIVLVHGAFADGSCWARDVVFIGNSTNLQEVRRHPTFADVVGNWCCVAEIADNRGRTSEAKAR